MEYKSRIASGPMAGVRAEEARKRSELEVARAAARVVLANAEARPVANPPVELDQPAES